MIAYTKNPLAEKSATRYNENGVNALFFFFQNGGTLPTHDHVLYIFSCLKKYILYMYIPFTI